MAPPFEQTLITLSQGLFICNIKEFCSAVLEKKIFKGFALNQLCSIVFGYYFTNNVGGATI